MVLQGEMTAAAYMLPTAAFIAKTAGLFEKGNNFRAKEPLAFFSLFGVP